MSLSVSKNFAELKPSSIREILKSSNEPGMIPFSAGSPAVEAFPNDEVREIMKSFSHDDMTGAMVYGISEGYEPLRKDVANWLKKYNGLDCPGNSIIITSGGTQVMDLAVRVLMSQGDTIICEDPTFTGSLNCIRSHGCKIAGVPIESDGMSISELKRVVAENKNAKVIYTIPNFQNPGGTTMSLKKRQELYEVAAENSIAIIEDDPYGLLRVSGESLPTIKSMDTENIVVYASSFSKTLAPGLRVAYTLLPNEIAGAFTIAKQAADVHTGLLNQIIVSNWIHNYDIDAHLEKIKKIYSRKLNLMCSELDERCSKFLSYVRPEGGLFIWAKLSEKIDMLEYVRRLLDRKVAVVPGTSFLCDETKECNYIRLNFSTPCDDDIVKGVEIMAEVAESMGV